MSDPENSDSVGAKVRDIVIAGLSPEKARELLDAQTKGLSPRSRTLVSENLKVIEGGKAFDETAVHTDLVSEPKHPLSWVDP